MLIVSNIINTQTKVVIIVNILINNTLETNISQMSDNL